MQLFSLALLCLIATPQVQGRRTQIANSGGQLAEALKNAEDPQEVSNPSSSLAEEDELLQGKEGKCPRWEPQLGNSGGTIPSLVIVTIKSAQNLAWSLIDNPDPYVEFWMGDEGTRQWWFRKNLMPGHKSEKYWRARTHALSDNTSPSWEWSCLMAYDSTNSNVTFQLWDRDLLTTNDFIGIAQGDLLAILGREDHRGDGEIDVTFQLKDKKGKKVTNRKGDKDSTLQVKFEVIRERTMYSITKGSGNVYNPATGGQNGPNVY